MERLSTLVVGWVFVGCGALLLVAVVGRTVLGHVAGWYEWPAVIALSALMLLIGLAVLIRDPPRWLPVAAVAGCGVFFTGFGIFALVAPEAASTTAAPGPRTAVGARLSGIALVLSGSATLVAARSVARRGRRGPAPEEPRG